MNGDSLSQEDRMCECYLADANIPRFVLCMWCNSWGKRRSKSCLQFSKYGWHQSEVL